MNKILKEFKINIVAEDSSYHWKKTLNELVEAGWNVKDNGDYLIIGDEENGVVKVIPDKRVGAMVSQTTGYEILKALNATQIEDMLVDSIPEHINVDKVIIGYNWTMVRTGNLCGIARSPQRGTEGPRTIRPKEGFINHSLSDLANYMKSSDPLCRTLGLAAINAYWNRTDAIYPEIIPIGGFAGIEPPGEGTIIIGGFRNALKRLPHARIVEREPQKGDIAVNQAKPYIQNSKTLAITAQTLMNGSLAPLLRLSEKSPNRMLIGPSAPLCPLLLKMGFQQISAVVIYNANEVERFICETGTMIMLGEAVRSTYLG